VLVVITLRVIASFQGSFEHCCLKLSEDRTCALLEKQAALKIDMPKACKFDQSELSKGCSATKQREEQLSKMSPCGRLFQRLVAGEQNKVNPEDVSLCDAQISSCNATCHT
jgi:hypothetical protein